MMYEYIKGEIAEVTPTYAVVDAAGVGYLVNISLNTYSQIEKSSSAKLFIHFIVREDAQLMYGFSSRQERELFRLLIGVSGVGGNTARMILSTYSPAEVVSIISKENDVLLKNVKGLGLKTAQKIIVELKDKIMNVAVGGTASDVSGGGVAVSSVLYDEAMSALTMLGFAKAASDKAVRLILKSSSSVSVEELIRMALKAL